MMNQVKSLFLYILNHIKRNQVLYFFILVSLVFLYKIGKIPYGIFVDEAEIGYKAYLLTQGKTDFLENIFFYQHIDYILGALPVYSTVPFVWLFGPNDFSVRLASVIFGIASLIIFYKILKELKYTKIFLPVILILLSPNFYHISRINFGHLPSLFFLFCGFYFYVKNSNKTKLLSQILSGLCFGIASYGYSSFILSSFLLLSLICFSEAIHHRLNIKKLRHLLMIIIVFIVSIIPIFYMFFNAPDFTKRFDQKNSDNPALFSIEKIEQILDNYPKYFNFEYLYTKGEIAMPGAFVTRHSVNNNGLLLGIDLVIIVSGYLIFILVKTPKKYLIAPFFILFLLYPIPDLLTTNTSRPPYSFAAFTTLFSVYFIIAFSINHLDKIFKKNVLSSIYLGLFIISILFGIQFFANYQKYPMLSSDYWGWQSGPKEIMNYYKKEVNNYDEMYLSGAFNAPNVYLNFYTAEKPCAKCYIGGLYSLDENKKQLFAIRPDEKEAYKNIYPSWKFNEVKSIYLPNGKVEFYIVKISIP